MPEGWNVGRLECWNAGTLKTRFLRNEIESYAVFADQKLKSVYHPLFIPNIPFFQHSIIPLAI